jgi:hypothetical protein
MALRPTEARSDPDRAGAEGRGCADGAPALAGGPAASSLLNGWVKSASASASDARRERGMEFPSTCPAAAKSDVRAAGEGLAAVVALSALGEMLEPVCAELAAAGASRPAASEATAMVVWPSMMRSPTAMCHWSISVPWRRVMLGSRSPARTNHVPLREESLNTSCRSGETEKVPAVSQTCREHQQYIIVREEIEQQKLKGSTIPTMFQLSKQLAKVRRLPRTVYSRDA